MNVVRIMHPAVNTATLRSTASVRQGLETLRHYGYTSIPVVDEEGRYVGCITEGDFLWYLVRERVTDWRELERRPIADLIRKDFCRALEITAGYEQIMELILQQNFIPIVDARGCLCGIVTRRAVMAFLEQQSKSE